MLCPARHTQEPALVGRVELRAEQRPGKERPESELELEPELESQPDSELEARHQLARAEVEPVQKQLACERSPLRQKSGGRLGKRGVLLGGV
jgi:hypothetical protein